MRVIARYRPVSLRTADKQIDPTAAQVSSAMLAWIVPSTAASVPVINCTASIATQTPASMVRQRHSRRRQRAKTAPDHCVSRSVPSVASALLSVQLSAAATNLAYRPRLCTGGTRTAVLHSRRLAQHSPHMQCGKRTIAVPCRRFARCHRTTLCTTSTRFGVSQTNGSSLLTHQTSPRQRRKSRPGDIESTAAGRP